MRSWPMPSGASQACAFIEYQVQQKRATTRRASPPWAAAAWLSLPPKATRSPPETARATAIARRPPIRWRVTSQSISTATTGWVARMAAAAIGPE